MQAPQSQYDNTTAIRTDLGAIFVSLELSRATWLVTSLSPGGGEKMSKHVVQGGDVGELLSRFAHLQEKVRGRTGHLFPIITIQEAGLDGFWIHRILQNHGVESHIVDAASIAASRRGRRAKTARIDGETLVRALLAFKRGEPRVCAMVRAPNPQDEDRRRVCRERRVLIAERVEHVNRIKGLLFAQGVGGYPADSSSCTKTQMILRPQFAAAVSAGFSDSRRSSRNQTITGRSDSGKGVSAAIVCYR